MEARYLLSLTSTLHNMRTRTLSLPNAHTHTHTHLSTQTCLHEHTQLYPAHIDQQQLALSLSLSLPLSEKRYLVVSVFWWRFSQTSWPWPNLLWMIKHVFNLKHRWPCGLRSHGLVVTSVAVQQEDPGSLPALFKCFLRGLHSASHPAAPGSKQGLDFFSHKKICRDLSIADEFIFILLSWWTVLEIEPI